MERRSRPGNAPATTTSRRTPSAPSCCSVGRTERASFRSMMTCTSEERCVPSSSTRQGEKDPPSASTRSRTLPALASALVAALLLQACAGAPIARARDDQPNVLFIVVDDLRPFIGAYGAPHARTPHLDALIGRGVMFEHAYCQQAVCNPSRSSLLTGRRPETTGVRDLETHFRARLPKVAT